MTRDLQRKNPNTQRTRVSTDGVISVPNARKLTQLSPTVRCFCGYAMSSREVPSEEILNASAEKEEALHARDSNYLR